MRGLWGWVVSLVRPTDTWENKDKLWIVSGSVKLLQNILGMKNQSWVVNHEKRKAFFQLLLINSTYRMKNKREDFTIITDSVCFGFVLLSKNVQNILFQNISLPREITFCILHGWKQYMPFLFSYEKQKLFQSISSITWIAKCYKHGTQLKVGIIFQYNHDTLEKLPY